MPHIDADLTDDELRVLNSATTHYQLVLNHAQSNVMSRDLYTAMEKINPPKKTIRKIRKRKK